MIIEKGTFIKKSTFLNVLVQLKMCCLIQSNWNHLCYVVILKPVFLAFIHNLLRVQFIMLFALPKCFHMNTLKICTRTMEQQISALLLLFHNCRTSHREREW